MSRSPDESPTALCLMGPTCAGKTALAGELARRLPVAIISVDSAMVYRGMDIGTAKPDAAMLAVAPHRLIDIRDPSQAYSAAEFRLDALREIAAAQAAGQVPLLVGGTGLYFRALAHGLAAMPPADAGVRADLQIQASRVGWPAMHAVLVGMDPSAALRIHPNDSQRIQRALEILTLTGRPISAWWADSRKSAAGVRLVKIVLCPPDRGILRDRVARRFDRMLAQGLMEEVQALYGRGDLTREHTAVRVVGYRQAWAYLEGTLDYHAMVAAAVTATRQLLKRQLTWLRAEADAQWRDPDAIACLPELAQIVERLARGG